ncbi:unnamed protein product, partial [Symbiodinium microadriaticum]
MAAFSGLYCPVTRQDAVDIDASSDRSRSRSYSSMLVPPRAFEWLQLGTGSAGTSKEIFKQQLQDPLVATRKWLAQNTSPDIIYYDMRGDFVKEDLYVCGFTCKLFSQDSNLRFTHSSVESMFDEAGPHATNVVPFLECSRFFILENVAGCLRQAANCPEDATFKVTVVSDDTNVWVNNASQKRHFSEGVCSETKPVKGMKRVQSLLGLLQHLIIRTDGEPDGVGTIAQVHAPCQLLPRANSFTILDRLRRWSLYASIGCAEPYGGRGLWDLFATVPLKLIVHCGDALPANHVVQAAEHIEWHEKRLAGDRNAATTLQTELNCLHHQAALALKPGLLSIPNLCSAMVRMTRAMRATKFQSLFQEGLEKIAQNVDRRLVGVLPASVAALQDNHRSLLDILGLDLKSEEKELILTMFNSSWDDDFAERGNGQWVHWCCGCCPNRLACIDRTREAVRLLFQAFPQVPLLYRWKGWGPVQNYVTRGIFIHNFLAFLIAGCYGKALDQITANLDEDSPDLSHAVKQEVRMGKTVAFITADSVKADLGKSLFVSWPLAELMDFISQVESCRLRLYLKSRSLELASSTCKITEQELREMNWSLFNGKRAAETIRDYTTLLTAPPGTELLAVCQVTFADILPHVFPALCDAWRRLCLPKEKVKTQLLGVGLMDVETAQKWLSDTS